MNYKKLLVLLIFMVSNTMFGQKTLNNYKYIIVPERYDFLKSKNQYQLNSLTKFLFKKEKFTALSAIDKKPRDLVKNPCLGLRANVISSSGMFATKLQVELKDCENKLIFLSKEGKSKEKGYRKGHHEALRSAFESFSDLNYTYSPNISEEKLGKTGKSLQKLPPPSSTINSNPQKEQKKEEVKKEVLEKISSSEEVIAIRRRPQDPPKMSEQIQVKDTVSVIVDINTLYAQANNLGYQLVDSTPRVIYVVLKSGRENVYFLRNKKGILYQENGQWIVEYYDLDKLVRKGIKIKF